MQTLNKTQYHCAELRGSVPLIQLVEWVRGSPRFQCNK